MNRCDRVQFQLCTRAGQEIAVTLARLCERAASERAITMRASQAALRRLRDRGTAAATVALLRDAASGGSPEVLLLKKSKGQRFSELWVFPGGKIDEEDAVHVDGHEDVLATAAAAAARELVEETQLVIAPSELCFFSHWLPPAAEAAKRGRAFSTFFFVGRASENAAAQVDGGEISRHQWMKPIDALERHAAGRLGMLPPTWMTLNTLTAYGSAEEAIRQLGAAEPECYETRMSVLPDQRTCYMWAGDAGWATCDPSVPGQRLRLVSSAPTAAADEQSGELGPLTRGASTLTLENTMSKL